MIITNLSTIMYYVSGKILYKYFHDDDDDDDVNVVHIFAM